MFICILSKIFGLVLPLLIGVAFLTLAERKVMASMQRRKGPNVVGLFGIFQPIADGLKLLVKEPVCICTLIKLLCDWTTVNTNDIFND